MTIFPSLKVPGISPHSYFVFDFPHSTKNRSKVASDGVSFMPFLKKETMRIYYFWTLLQKIIGELS